MNAVRRRGGAFMHRGTAATRRMGALTWLMASVLVTGCATVREGRAGPGQKLDPWESWNRKVFNFNESVDKAVLIPVATAYQTVVPQPMRRGVGNFFGNFADAWSGVNNVLQGKFQASVEDFTRVGANTLFGLLGFLDVASEMGIDHKYEDFGQTLGRYGFGAGAYVVLPILGPSSVRDAAAMPVDRLASPTALIDGTGTHLALGALQIVNTRSGLLGATRVIDDIALDKYTFVRDAYLQRRRSLVFDGDAPEAPGAAQPSQGTAANAPEAAASDAGAAAGNVAPPPQATPQDPPPAEPARPASSPTR